MTLNVEAALVGFHALMDTIPDLQRVRIGAPEALTNQIEGWVSVAELDQEVTQRAAGGPYEMRIALIGHFGYVVEGVEESAEREMSQYISEITRRLIQNRMRTVDGVTAMLNGSAIRMGLPRPAAEPADYARFAGSEVRIYPIAVTVTLSETIT